MKWTLILATLLALAAAMIPAARSAPRARACAFATAPNTYETTEDRRLYMAAMDLAGYNMLFPGDNFFSQYGIETGTRTNRTSSLDVYVPPTLLKAISWIESVTTQAAPGVPFGSVGPALVAFDCGYGISQVTSGMTIPLGESGQPTNEQSLVATDFAYNIGRGAAILIDKWNAAPTDRPIVGIDTNSDPHLIENWYYAVWSYNGFTGPGANKSNHPLDPVYGTWPRTSYSCGPASDGLSHNRALYPYQELVYGCAAHPPVVQGTKVWQPVAASLPDLNNPYWRTPLDLKNFQAPYSKMDIPTPKPQHTDPTPAPTGLHRLAVLGFPSITVDRQIVLVNIRPGQSATPVQVKISNVGSGIAPWRASANKSWVTLAQPSGIAIGDDLTCTAACDRSGALTISVDPRKIVGSDAAVVHVDALGAAGGDTDIAVFVQANVAIGVPGITKN